MKAHDCTEWLTAFGRQHHGIVSWREAQRAGIPYKAIVHRVQRGELVWLAPGIYRLRDHPDTWESRLWGALLEAGPGAVVSHRSAARLHGMYRYRSATEIEVLKKRGRDHDITLGHLHQTKLLDTDHVMVVGGYPCTTVARTIFDLCGDPDFPARSDGAKGAWRLRMLQVANDALRWHGLTVERELAVLAALGKRGRSGTALVREIFKEMGCRYVPTDTDLETVFFELMRNAEIPEPDKQRPLAGDRGWAGTVDFVWKPQKVVVECDSSWHDGPLDIKADEERDAALRAAGWEILRFRWSDLVLTPEKVVRKVRRALRRSEPVADSAPIGAEVT
ncbi:MAG: DUF559 domain-containing protein, partial [Acidimicrobiales bacterium]